MTTWISPRELVIPFAKFNENHDEIGRFASAPGAASSDPIGATARYRATIGNRSRAAHDATSLPPDADPVERTLFAHGSNDLLHAPDSTHISQDYVRGVMGSYNDHRRSQQNQILNAYRDKAESVPSDRRAIIMGGLGGAGKSSAISANAQAPGSIASKLGIKFSSYDKDGNGVGEPSNFVVLNPDNVKEQMASMGMVPKIGELSPMEASVFTHEEASSITKDLATEMLAQGKNVIWDITLHSLKSGSGKLANLKAQGYHVAGAFVDVSTTKSLNNAQKRHDHGQADYAAGKGYGGRYVPPALITSAGDPSGTYRSENRSAFEGLKDSGAFDQTVTIDNEHYQRKVIDETGHIGRGHLPPPGPVSDQRQFAAPVDSGVQTVRWNYSHPDADNRLLLH